ncbi:hypothetical protein Trydic_g12569, partial [Trypoxylus dichotomus]
CDRTDAGNGGGNNGGGNNGGGDNGGGQPGGNGSGPLIACPADGTYLPDKTDCSIYYVCAYGTAIAQKCPQGLYYDGTIWSCTYPDQATCFTYTPSGEDNGNGSGGPVGGGAVGSCPVDSDPDVEVFLPDSEVCGIFYQCSGGVPIALSCPEGLNFNTETDQCDYPENVNCDRTDAGNGGGNNGGG